MMHGQTYIEYEDVWTPDLLWAFLEKRQSSCTCQKSDQLLNIKRVTEEDIWA